MNYLRDMFHQAVTLTKGIGNSVIESDLVKMLIGFGGMALLLDPRITTARFVIFFVGTTIAVERLDRSCSLLTTVLSPLPIQGQEPTDPGNVFFMRNGVIAAEGGPRPGR